MGFHHLSSPRQKLVSASADIMMSADKFTHEALSNVCARSAAWFLAAWLQPAGANYCMHNDITSCKMRARNSFAPSCKSSLSRTVSTVEQHVQIDKCFADHWVLALHAQTARLDTRHLHTHFFAHVALQASLSATLQSSARCFSPISVICLVLCTCCIGAESNLMYKSPASIASCLFVQLFCDLIRSMHSPSSASVLHSLESITHRLTLIRRRPRHDGGWSRGWCGSWERPRAAGTRAPPRRSPSCAHRPASPATPLLI